MIFCRREITLLIALAVHKTPRRPDMCTRIGQTYLFRRKRKVGGKSAIQSENYSMIGRSSHCMVATHTEKAFLDFILSHDELHNLHAVQELMCPSFCDTLIFDYDRNALNDSELLKNIVISYPKEDSICQKLQKAIYSKTGNFIAPWSYQNQEALRIEGKQRCFDALFSRPKFLELVKKLGLTIGMEHPINDHNAAKKYPSILRLSCLSNATLESKVNCSSRVLTIATPVVTPSFIYRTSPNSGLHRS